MFYETKNRHMLISKSNNFAFTKHLHHEIELRICTKGSLDVLCNGQRRILYPGDIMIACPNDIHEYFETDSGEGYMLIFKPDISPIIKKLINERRYENFISMKELIPLFEDMFIEFKNNSNSIAYGYVHIIAGKIFKKLPYSKITKTEESDLLTETLKFISENYTTPISLKSVAKKIGVTHNHLSRLFSEKIQGGFCSYVNMLRVHHACELLKSTNLTMYEILSGSGFSNERTFYRVFKTETGQSPKEYRKTHLKT